MGRYSLKSFSREIVPVGTKFKRLDDFFPGFWYRGVVRRLVMDVKYNGDYSGMWYAMQTYPQMLFSLGMPLDCMVFVPSSAPLVWEIRKYLLARFTGVPACNCVSVRKFEWMESVKDVGRGEKGVCVERKFDIASGFRGQVPKNVLLIDDVCTSGATLNRVRALLIQNGALRVWCTSLAVGFLKW